MAPESPTTPADPRPSPIAARSEADGPLFAYDLNVYYPNEGGRVTESGQTTAAKLVQRLRDEADQIERIARLMGLPDTEGVAPLRASGTPGQSVEVVAAEIEAHASQSIPALDLDLIRALASGLSLKEYAAREGLTATTASQRAIRMRQRLGVTSNEQATHEATLRGLLKGVPRP